jgi:hypothetical protein
LLVDSVESMMMHGLANPKFSGSLLVCVHCTVGKWTILTTVTLASTSNPLPDDGVTAPKHVGAVLMSILMQI